MSELIKNAATGASYLTGQNQHLTGGRSLLSDIGNFFKGNGKSPAALKQPNVTGSPAFVFGARDMLQNANNEMKKAMPQ